jgi:peroxiredoxin
MFTSRFRRILPLVAAALLLLLPLPASAILQKGQPAPLFSLPSHAGQPVNLAAYKGKVVVLDFFATWCLPCRESIPHLISLSKKYGPQGLQVIGMSVDEEMDKTLKEFIADKKISYPVVLANDDLQADYALRSIPMIWVINKKGVVAEKYQGYNDKVAKNIEELIRKLLAE